MDVREARTVLRVGDADGWDEIRASYRRLIRLAHPDVAGGRRPHREAALLNQAYAVLSRARREGRLHAPPRPASAPAPAPPPPPPPLHGARALGDDTILLAAPPDGAFGLLLDAGHRIGSVSYVDRSCAIFEVVVQLDGEACSLVITVTPRGHGSEAELTVESLGRVASHSPAPVLRRLLTLIG